MNSPPYRHSSLARVRPGKRVCVKTCTRYYIKAPANLVEALAVARQYGDQEFLVYEGERRSFTRLMDEADALAAALQARGMCVGDRVALAMRNYPEWMAVFIAA